MPKATGLKPGKTPPRSRGTRQTPDSIKRDAEALHLKSMGWTYAQVRAHLKFGSIAAVQLAVERAVAAIRDEPARVVREQMLSRLDMATNAAMVALTAVYRSFHQGEPLTYTDPDTKITTPVLDYGPVLDAARTVVKLDERRDKLLGIGVPDRQEISITRVPEFVEGWLAEEKRKALERLDSDKE
jgi:hypothetical protein